MSVSAKESVFKVDRDRIINGIIDKLERQGYNPKLEGQQDSDIYYISLWNPKPFSHSGNPICLGHFRVDFQ